MLFRSERALEALRLLAAPMAHVVRDGVEQALPSRDLVPGDLIVLRAGDRVPADARITLAVNLTIDEAALTGESVPVAKRTGTLAEQTPLGDRTNMVFSGSLVTSGTGRVLIVNTEGATAPATYAELVGASADAVLARQGAWRAQTLVAA